MLRAFDIWQSRLPAQQLHPVSDGILSTSLMPFCVQVRAAGAIGLASMAAAGVTAAYVTVAIPDKELRYVLASTPRSLVCLAALGFNCYLSHAFYQSIAIVK